MKYPFRSVKSFFRSRRARVGAAAVLGGTALFGVLFLAWFLRDIPSPTRLSSSDNIAVSSQVLDRNGTLLYEIFADENRTPIEIDTLPEYVGQASISIEDKNFYNHFGLDFVGIARALLTNLLTQKLQGGSTITQQLVKVSLLTRERTWERKAKEAVLTVATEVLYSKKDILEMYLNHIPYGGTAWGIESASQYYFNKPAKDLSLPEAAFLAGLPQSPSRYSPFGNTPERGIERQKEVLRRMAEDGYITAEQAESAQNTELAFAAKRFDIKAPHFVIDVRDQLTEQYGQHMVEQGGLRVTTTLDLELQTVLQASLSAEIATLERQQVGNGAALITRPKTGEILAMIGSRDYFDATHEGQINMTVRERQPGSSIKPLNLAAAFQTRRVTPATVLLDIPTCFKAIGQADYCPRNYDGSFRGPVRVRQALANSYNIPAVKILAMNSLSNFMPIARSLGLMTLQDQQRYGLSLALGGGEVTMRDMATAYGTLANEGVRVPVISILKVETYTGEVLYDSKLDERAQAVDALQFLAPATPADERDPILPDDVDGVDDIERVLDREVAFLVNDIMSDNEARSAAFGTRSQLFVPGHRVAAKTGTTNDLKDNWTVGFTPDYLGIVWVGNTDNSRMNQSLVSGVTGAAPIWNDLMSWTLKDVETEWPDRPATIVEAPFCERSGKLPDPGTPAEHQCAPVTELFWVGTEPQETEAGIWRETWIADQTGLPPKEGDPTDNLKLEAHVLLNDAFTRDYCLTCARKTVEVPKEDGTMEAKPVPESYAVTAERLFQVAGGYTGWE